MYEELQIPPHELDRLELKHKLLGSYLYFTCVFYKLITGRDFVISEPAGRPSHHILIARELTDVFYGLNDRLLINIPPRMGKSTMCVYFIAWSLAHYPDSNFIYISFGHELAAGHTYKIRQILAHPLYKKLFGVCIDSASRAKDDFLTNYGGAVQAFGSSGPITGKDAGLPNAGRFSGAVIIDDAHKPDEVHSDTIRERVIKNYNETIKPRLVLGVPCFFIGQRLRERDLPDTLIAGEDGYDWKKIIIKGLDENNNALHPTVHSKEFLLREKEFNAYVFASQYQQDPIPAGGSIFKSASFVLLDEEPDIIATFLTVDCAETDKNYNDATVFTFWGLYKIKTGHIDTGLYGLHCIDCSQIRVNIEDLEAEFLDFYASCMRHHIKPQRIGIEKKSAGTTLLALLKKYQGMELMNIERTKASGSKTTRYLEMAPWVAAGHFSFMRNGKHTKMCIEHMSKITANNTHAHDDIADTYYDACKIALIDKTLIYQVINPTKNDELARKVMSNFNAIQAAKAQRYLS